MSGALLAALLLGVLATPSHGQHHDRSKSKASKVQTPKVGAYSCPMHPEVKSGKPGRCRKCGMNLGLTTPASQTTTASSAVKDAAVSTGAKLAIPDVQLYDQDGRKVHFYSDLVRDRIVVINFIFTSCTTICPPLGATFARVQKELGERAGRDVRFVSISVDPATDTPERLKAWGAKFHAGAAWTFVTGDRPLINELLLALGATSASPQDHSPTVLIVDDARGQWTRTYGLSPPRQLVKLINDAVEGRLNLQEAAR